MDIGKSYQIRLRAPGASEVMLVSGDVRTPLTRTGDEFSATMVACQGETVVYAKFGASDKYLGLLKYVGR
jgi:hypothetical protein